MPTPTYDLIASSVLGSAAATVSFSSISGSYRDLILVVDGTPSTSASLYLRFNSDSGSNYNYVLMEGHPTLGARSAATTGTDLSIGFVTAKFSSQTSIQDYSVTDKHKSVLSRTGESDRTTATAGRWANTSAITTILVGVGSGTFNTGSSFYLYGLVS